ncbi:MAG TPA: LytTR family DNA-binding domain-containing protein [Flavisolibacter sp.]|jgi:DNA-binding LytR/AlgR family response regulator|nr:LytTR family DNA-binding domain-containing protein [Flavisolibacter sp.]
MKKISCLILEDEPLAAEVLEEYISQVPFLECKAKCVDAVYAMDVLQQQQIDLIFLDIHLPGLKGLDFLKSLRFPPRIIITTAYQEYALEGYELNVLDYLLKPIEWSRFLKAIDKLRGEKEPELQQMKQSVVPDDKAHVFFNVNKRMVKVFLDEILYIESLKEYIRITTHNKSILTKYQLNEIEELLTRNQFLRIHRSFIVARNKIETFSATDVEVGGKQLPIGRNYKEAVIKALGNAGQ